MHDYDLTGLSTRSFEQMIQALACKTIGPGIVVFGDGPDGGREATFSGQLSSFPSQAKGWNGYVVLQAKFCQRPKRKLKEDERWASELLKKELQAFARPHNKRRKPQFYIFATNITLSPVNKRGGKDSLSRLIESYKKKIGLKDYRIWDYDQICRFLDSDQDVRKAYGAWITPGDVLAKLAATIDKATPNFSKVMMNFLQKELLDDHYSKLEQAGHSPENRIPLEQVFIDLPAFESRRSEAPREASELPPGFLAEMISVGSMCLHPEEPGQFESKTDLAQPITNERQGRFVLIGGPGQGKSTLTQFLCQIQRANLLTGRRGLEVDVRDAVESIATHCSSQQLQLTSARRFPLRLELARFAKVLASQTETGVNSVLSYFASMVKDRTDYNISVDDLRKWLEIYPWLVILDGLDEVPASSNRTEVLSSIRDFLIDVSMCNGDVLILATTRPQGYNDEFSPQNYQHRWLAPLSNTRALHYGQTLIELTYAHNAPRKKEIFTRLKSAATSRATARLMESPLQVTIMARLLAQIAQPPQERYKLFQQYYKIIYRREMERGVETLSQILRDHEANVDSIHQRTGLLLQLESERTRHTDATITIVDFKVVVTDRLREEGYSGITLQELAESITTCATNRLVFLVPSQSDRVGFEIRSLQEFMAAEALMGGTDHVVVERLRAIAPVPFWQNVLLFAAGKCFAERQWLRDCVSQICCELNDDPSDNLAHLVLAGSRMAVSLLEDGPARQQPAYSQVLARRALELLALPPESVHSRLVDVYEQSFEIVYREELSRELNAKEVRRCLAAWQVITTLATTKSIRWAQELAENHYPASPSERIELLRTLDPMENGWAMEKYTRSFFEMPLLWHPRPPDLRHNGFAALKLNPLAYKVAKLIEHWSMSNSKTGPNFSIEGLGQIDTGLVMLSESRRRLQPLSSLAMHKEVYPYWKVWKEAVKVVQQLSIDSVADALETLAESLITIPLPYYYRPVLPWPLLACLNAARSKAQIQQFAARMRAGEMGGPEQWLAAEKRWQANGITDNDLVHMTDEQWPIPRDIATIGFPFAIAKHNWRIVLGGRKPGKLDEIQKFWRTLPGVESKKVFAEYLTRFSFFTPRSMRSTDRITIPEESIPFLTELITYLEPDFFLLSDLPLRIYREHKNNKTVRHFFDQFGRRSFHRHLFARVYHEEFQPRELQELAGALLTWIEEDPSQHGLIKLLCTLASVVSVTRPPKFPHDLSKHDGIEVLSSFLALQLCDPHLDTMEMENLGDHILRECSHEPEFIATALAVYENHQMQNPSGIAFLERLNDGLPHTMISQRRTVLRILMELLGRRIAPLGDRQTWEKLELPKNLFSVIRN